MSENYKVTDALSNLRFYVKDNEQIYLVGMSGRSSFDSAKRLSMHQKIYIQKEVAGVVQKIEVPIKFTIPQERIYTYDDYLFNIKEAIDSYQDVIQNTEKYIKEYGDGGSR